MVHGGMRRIAELPEEKAKNQTRVVRRLVALMKPYRRAVAGALVFILISAGSQASGPALIGRAVDQFIARSDIPGLSRTMLALLAVYLVGMLAMRFQIYLIASIGQRVLARLRTQIMARVQSLSLQYIEGEEAGDLMSRLVNDIDAINTFFGQALSQAIGSIFAVIGIVIAMLLLNWKLALAALAVVPLMVMTTGGFARLARRAFRRTRATIGDVSADIQEEISGIKVAQAFNRSGRNIRDFARRNAANRDANVSANAVTSAFAPAMDLLSTIDTAIVAGYGGYLAISGAVSVGVVVAFLQYVQNFFRPIQAVSQIWTIAQSAFAAAERVFELIDTVPQLDDAPDAEAMPRINGEIRFEQVTFGYDPVQPVLEEVSLSAQPGSTVAVVGPTGAGKTTLVNLIPRFYDVTGGRILVDGRDVRQVTRRSLRTQMSMVLQEPFLFSGTVMENIRYGKLDASDDQVVQAARAANADRFIARLPEGYDTPVGERGGLLSQGQRQLIAIARAILADPRILILDEATASVDTRTERLIQEALGHLLRGRTSLVIAHRLSTVRNADLVLVLEGGRVVERGSHQELLERGGLYAELYQRQFYVPPEERAAAMLN